MSTLSVSMMTDFPKLECPFVRKTYPIPKEDWKKHGSRYQLRAPEVYLVTPEVNPGYEWVLEDPETIAVEKLNGTNVKIRTENGRLVAAQNRKEPIDLLQLVHGKTFLAEGIFMAVQKDYVLPDGEQGGEIVGPKLQGNPYGLPLHLWYPFSRAIKYLSFRSFHEHARTFENWSSWFRDHLKSRFHTKLVGSEQACFAEGVVFYNLKRRAAGASWMAKLRRDMFDWYYPDLRIAR